MFLFYTKFSPTRESRFPNPNPYVQFNIRHYIPVPNHVGIPQREEEISRVIDKKSEGEGTGAVKNN